MSLLVFYNKFLKAQTAMFLEDIYNLPSEIAVLKNSLQPLWYTATSVLATACLNFSLPQIFRVFKFISGKLYENMRNVIN